MHQPVERKHHTCRRCEADVTIKGWYCYCVPCTLQMEKLMGYRESLSRDAVPQPQGGWCTKHGRFEAKESPWCPKCDPVPDNSLTLCGSCGKPVVLGSCCHALWTVQERLRKLEGKP